MKRFLLGLTLAVSTFASSAQAKEVDWIEKLVLYVPNRLLDALDTFSVSVGAGPVLKAEVRATRFLDFGAGFGVAAKLVKENNRQYGVAVDNGYNLNFGPVVEESFVRSYATRSVFEVGECNRGMSWPGMNIYEPNTGMRDYWEFGGNLSCLLDTYVGVHPVEIADFLTGIFMYDLKDDDKGFKDFR